MSKAIQEYNRIKKLLMLSAAVAAAMMVRAETETVGGYTWTDCIDGGKTGIVV